ncbi:SDR family oxidoreductase [Methanospirillum sp.]
MKIAIVTGASGGIGKSVSDGLKLNDYTVHDVSRKNCDVTDSRQVYEYVKKIPHVDVLVNCAGISHLGHVDNISEEDVLSLFDVNVLGVIRFCKAVLPVMKKQGKGYIINIGSLRGIEYCPGKSVYSLSKAAVRAFSITLGKEVQPYGIKVTVINPGFVHTPLIKHRIEEENLKEGDILSPLDIQKTVLYLLSLSEGAYVPELNLGEVWQ